MNRFVSIQAVTGHESVNGDPNVSAMKLEVVIATEVAAVVNIYESYCDLVLRVCTDNNFPYTSQKDPLEAARVGLSDCRSMLNKNLGMMI